MDDADKKEATTKHPPRPSVAALCRAIRCRDAFDMERHFAGELAGRVRLHQIRRTLAAEREHKCACNDAGLVRYYGRGYDWSGIPVTAELVEDKLVLMCKDINNDIARDFSIWAYSVSPVTIEQERYLMWGVQYHR